MIDPTNINVPAFFTKRFDRLNGERIHFASAMTMTGNNEDSIRDKPASYLDIVEFISNHGANIDSNLHQLWRRIIFNIAISNTDDHLRNHGFILTKDGWILSPAYDLNPSIDKSGLALNIDQDSNELNFNLAKSVGQYFQLNKIEMENKLAEVGMKYLDKFSDALDNIKNGKVIDTEVEGVVIDDNGKPANIIKKTTVLRPKEFEKIEAILSKIERVLVF